MTNKEHYLEKELFEARDRLREYERRDYRYDPARRFASIELVARLYRDIGLLLTVLVIAFFAYKLIEPSTQLVSSIAERNFAEARETHVQADSLLPREESTPMVSSELSAPTEPEPIIIEEALYKEIERSWLYRAAFNWLLPGFLVLVSGYSVVFGVLLLLERYGGVFTSNKRTAFSVVSAGTSTAGMVFAAIRYKSELLEHEVGSYLFLSSLSALIFFVLLLSTSNKLLSGIIYLICLSFVVLVSKYTTGSFGTPIAEYRNFLSSLAIPYQTVVVLGTILPVILVFLALIPRVSDSEASA